MTVYCESKSTDECTWLEVHIPLKDNLIPLEALPDLVNAIALRCDSARLQRLAIEASDAYFARWPDIPPDG
jgi:hypothetical protein